MLLGVSVVVRGQANLLFSHSLFWPHLWRGPSGTKCLIFQIQHGDTYRRFSVAATALIRSNILVVFIHVAVMSDFVHCYSIWLSKNINSWLKGSWFKLPALEISLPCFSRPTQESCFCWQKVPSVPVFHLKNVQKLIFYPHCMFGM